MESAFAILLDDPVVVVVVVVATVAWEFEFEFKKVTTLSRFDAERVSERLHYPFDFYYS